MNAHHQTLINAIRNRQIISFTYRGHQRTIEPHAYGVSTAGNDVLRGYQTAGTSHAGPVPDWKLMTVTNITNLTWTGLTFSSVRAGYKTNDSAMQRIYAQL